MAVQHQLGLIGYPLSHSFSEKYFAQKFLEENIEGYNYQLFPIEKIGLLSDLMENHPNLLGLNVTIPYKELVFPFMDEVSEAVKEIGALNTIKIENGKIKGYNTDVYGFGESLKPFLKSHHKKALILGTGGAAKAVKFVFNSLDIFYKSVSRTPEANQLTYADITAELLETYHIIVNTTPLGTYPNEGTYPNITYEGLSDKHLLYDLVYNPAESLFLKKGKSQQASIKNGLEMLHLQAEKAWEIWTT
mgnify:CR=1 FL=1